MKKTNSLYHGHRFPAVVISRAVRWYFRFSLSLRDMALVQIADGAEMPSINKDTLFIEQDGIPDGWRSGILESKSVEIELTLANAVHQLDP